MEVSIDCDLSIWSLRAIQAAAYELAEASATIITSTSDKIVRVKLRYDASRDQSPQEFIDKFMAKLLDHQVRQDTFKEFKVIREMIVAQAFEPCENIYEVSATIVP